MWAPIAAYLVKNAAQIAVSLAITLLEKSGYLAKWQATGIRIGTHVLQVVENTKTYSHNDQLDPSKSDFPAEVNSGGR